jgi:hypothetical protein
MGLESEWSSGRKIEGDICCQIAVKRRNNPDTNTLKLLYKGLELYRVRLYSFLCRI